MGFHTLLILCLTTLWALVSAGTLSISNDVPRTYSGVWTDQSPIFLRRTDLLNQRFHYETFEINVNTSGVYTFKSESRVKGFGYLYKDSFDPINPKANLIAQDGNNENGGQFKIITTLEANRKYILVATTNDPETTGEFSIVVSGSQSQTNDKTDTLMAKSDYVSFVSGNLAVSSPTFYRPPSTDGAYYYQAFLVSVYTSGTYSFISNSSLDTYGYLYSQSFDPAFPNTNIVDYNDDNGGNGQFRIDRYLQAGTTNILVVTTYAPGVRGAFGVRAVGPNSVDLMAYRPGSTVSSTTQGPSTSYTSSLTSSSSVFYRDGGSGLYYYQAFQVTIYTPGQYTFSSTASNFDTYGYLYSSSMDPSYPTQYILGQNDDGGGGQDFRIIYNVGYSATFVVVVTSYSAGVTGRFTVRASGPVSVYLTPFTPATSRPISTSVTTILPPTSYYGTLPSNNLVFFRPTQSDGYYYYEALRITVSVSGTYTFTSVSNIDTYGLLYYSPVDPSYSSQNLITYDDDNGGSRQFKITQYLQSGTTYVLLVTTYAPNVRGSYTLRTSGPQSATIYSFTPSTSRPIRTTTSYSYSSGPKISSIGIIGIVFGCLFIFVLIVSACTYSQKQRTIAARRVNSAYSPARVAAVNVTRPNGVGAPYTIPMQSVYVHSVEEAPPSYDQVAAYLKTPQR